MVECCRGRRMVGKKKEVGDMTGGDRVEGWSYSERWMWTVVRSDVVGPDERSSA